jgi:hypothetical protein
MLEKPEQMTNDQEQGREGQQVYGNTANLEHRHQLIGVGALHVALRQIVNLTVFVPHPANIRQSREMVNG